MKHSRHERWGSRLGIVLAVAGSAVGLGNFLRFPGLAAQYGGAAFLFAYFVSLLLIGIPVSWAEWTLGRLGGRFWLHSSPGIFHALSRRPWGKYLGAAGILVPLVVVMYYLHIESWCLGYAWNAATGKLAESSGTPQLATAFFTEFTGAAQDGSATRFDALACLFVALAVNFALLYRGVSRGIEWLCRIAMPVLFLLAAVLLVRVLTLETPTPEHPERTIAAALGHLWNPSADTLAQLGRPQLWLAAAGQVFFSLTVGMGAIITYASYLRKRDDVTMSSLAAVSANEFCEVVLGGMTTVPAAFLFLGASGAVGGTFALGFNVLPQVFARMPAGSFFGTAFFALLSIAALTSSLSLLQPVLAFIEEALALPRRISALLLGSVVSLGAIWTWYFSANLKALDVMDFWAGNVGVFVLGTLIIVFFGWVVGINRAWRHIHQGALLRVPAPFKFIMRYISPLYLLSIFLLFILKDAVGWNFSFADAQFQPTSYVTDLIGPNASLVAQLTIALMLVLAVAVLALIRVAAHRHWVTNRVLLAMERRHAAHAAARLAAEHGTAEPTQRTQSDSAPPLTR